MKKLIPIIFMLAMALSFLQEQAFAQTGCTGDPCLFFTPTPNAGTSTPQPTVGPGTPTPVPGVSPTGFPQYQYGIPTAISTLMLPATPNPNVQLTPLATFQPLQPDFTPPPLPSVTFEPLATPELPSTTPLATFAPFAATPWAGDALATFEPFAATPWAFSISTPVLGSVLTPFNYWPATPTGYGSTPVPLSTMLPSIPITYTEPLTKFTVATNTLDLTWYSQTITDVISYTNSVTNSVVQSTQSITVITAPVDYVPDLPRPLANIGWTFEQLGSEDSQANFTISSWSSFIGYMAAAPFQLIKMLWLFAVRFPILALVLSWLFIMVALVVWLRLLRAIYHLVWAIVDFVIKIIDLAGQYLPTGG